MFEETVKALEEVAESKKSELQEQITLLDDYLQDLLYCADFGDLAATINKHNLPHD